MCAGCPPNQSALCISSNCTIVTHPSSFRYESIDKLEHVPLFVKSGVGLVFIENVRRGTASSARLFTSIQTLVRDSRVLSSVVADRVRLSSGKWYFEVHISNSTQNGRCSIGFASEFPQTPRCPSRLWFS